LKGPKDFKPEFCSEKIAKGGEIEGAGTRKRGPRIFKSRMNGERMQGEVDTYNYKRTALRRLSPG